MVFKARTKQIRRMKLIVKGVGAYEADTFWQIIIEVLKHRTWHLFKHGKWMD